MGKGRIIGIDVDGVLADLDREWLARYNLESGDALTPELLTSWEIGDHVRPGWKPRLYEILNDPWIYLNVKAYEGALEVVQELRHHGRVIFITSSPPNHLSTKFSWLVKNGFLDTVTSCADYFPVKDKWLVNADLLIDDHVKNVEAFRQEAFLVTRPHNIKLQCERNRIPGVGLNEHVIPMVEQLFKQL